MSNSSKLVTIYTPKNREELLVIKALLDSIEIQYYTVNEQVQDLFGGGGFLVFTGAIKIQVDEKNVEEVLQIIDSDPILNKNE